MSVPLTRPYYGVSWGRAIARFFGNYATFRGRASRSEYWWWALTNALVTLALNYLGQLAMPGEWRDAALALPLFTGSFGSTESVVGVVALVYGLATLLPNLALTWRRLHDTDRSGAWFFIFLLPVIGIIVLVIFLAGHSRPGGTRFD